MIFGNYFVYQFFPDGTKECMAQRVGSSSADTIAVCCTQKPAAAMGLIRRIIITDQDDRTVFEWLFGKGVVPQTPGTEASLR